MDEEKIRTIEILLMEAENRAKELHDDMSDEQPGSTNANFLHSNICKALAHLRALKAMIK